MTTARIYPKRMPRDAYRAALRALIAAREPGRFHIFGTSVEGEIFPDGMDKTTGLVLTPDGRVFYFRTAWDAEAGAATLAVWKPIDPAGVHPESLRHAREEADG
jgi:hypothetical protein